MLDLNFIRQFPETTKNRLARRGQAHAAQIDLLLEIDDEFRSASTALQTLQAERNASSAAIGALVKIGDTAGAEAAKLRVADVKSRIATLAGTVADHQTRRDAILHRLPNFPLDGVPDGEDETGNVELRQGGTKPTFDFEPKEHFDLGEAMSEMDFETAARLSGSRFVILSGELARMERALGQFMLDQHVEWHDYREVAPPVLVRQEAMFGTGQLPKFAEDLFRTDGGHYLIPTAEVSLTNIVADQIIDDPQPLLRYTALTPCFRAEAGSAGRDTRGMLRQHQFNKVELVSITGEPVVASNDFIEEHTRMLNCAESIMSKLGLHYRVMNLCAGDMGFSAAKTFDIEVWLPGQNAYREIASVSYCGDFQARRMNARYRKDGEVHFLHTFNGSGVAVGRALIAVMENFQNADGSITVPKVLNRYMGAENGETIILGGNAERTSD